MPAIRADVLPLCRSGLNPFLALPAEPQEPLSGRDLFPWTNHRPVGPSYSLRDGPIEETLRQLMQAR